MADKPAIKAASARLLAAKAINDVIVKGRSLNTALPEAQNLANKEDRALIQELCFGVCRRYFSLNAIQTACLDKPLKSKDAIVSSLINVGIYQLLYTRIAVHAAIFETVEACKATDRSHLHKLVNAILQRVSREDYEIAESDETSFDHPTWMIAKLKHNWPAKWEQILQNNNTQPPMTIRVNARHADRDSYLLQLKEQSIPANACKWASCGITLEESVKVDRLPGFFEGHASVQDEAAQLCVDLLKLEDNQRVLDACAAPGGKTCAILERCDAELWAIDSEASRVVSITENFERLQLNATLKVAKAQELSDWWDNSLFDRVLVDAPCSASGVIRRHPDIKLLRKEQDILPLADIQLHLLKTLWATLKPSGILLYATCSVFSQENDRIIARFLKSEPTAELDLIESDWGKTTQFGKQFFPEDKGHDGFYYARLRKTDGQTTEPEDSN